MKSWLKALILMSLLSFPSCTTRPTVLPDSRQLTCVAFSDGEAPVCQRYGIDAGYLREIMIRLSDCKPRP